MFIAVDGEIGADPVPGHVHKLGIMAGGSVTVIDPGEEELSAGSLKHFGFVLHKGCRMRLRGADQKITGPELQRKRAKDNQQNDKISHDVLRRQGAANGEVSPSVFVIF